MNWEEVWRLLVPLWSANVAVNLLYLFRKRYGFWDFPLDGGRHLPDGNRIIGDAKTILGLPVCISFGWLGGLMVTNQNGWLLGLCVYLGAVVSGFIKRRLSLPRGEPLWVIDQSDYLLMTYFVYIVTGRTIANEVFLVTFLVAVPVHTAANVVFHRYSLRDVPW